MLEQCKLKSEDFEKFKKDQMDAEVLEQKKSISRMTLRSMAAKTIAKISSKTYDGKQLVVYREVPDRGLCGFEEPPRKVPEFEALMGRAVSGVEYLTIS